MSDEINNDPERPSIIGQILRQLAAIDAETAKLYCAERLESLEADAADRRTAAIRNLLSEIGRA